MMSHPLPAPESFPKNGPPLGGGPSQAATPCCPHREPLFSDPLPALPGCRRAPVSCVCYQNVETAPRQWLNSNCFEPRMLRATLALPAGPSP